MSDRRDRAHIVVRAAPQAEPYGVWPPGGGTLPTLPVLPGSRREHADALKKSLTQAAEASRTRRAAAPVVGLERSPRGMTIQFDSFPGAALVLKSLEREASGIELLSVVRVLAADTGHSTEQACVFVPEGKEQIFLRQFEAFASEETKKGKPRNQPLVQRIADLRLATLRALWTDAFAMRS